MAIYAAYASNLDPAQMVKRAPHSPLRGTGWLHGWRLTFGGEDVGWDGSLPTIVEHPDAATYVALYDVTEMDEPGLDEWEGASLGLYTKIRLVVETLERQEQAWLYVLEDYEGGLPSARTIGMISEAAGRLGAPDEYVQAIRELPCRSVG